jgi:hypothetical protein
MVAVVLGAAACGGGDSGDDGDNVGDDSGDDVPPVDAPIDAEVADAEVPDAEVPDAEVPDAGPPPSPGSYVVSRILVPSTVAEVSMFALDLDGDQPGGDPAPDNQLGAVLNALATMGLSTQASLDLAVDIGTAITLVAVGDATVVTATGLDPDPPACAGPGDCGHHLEGDASFTVGPHVGSMTMSSATAAGPGTAVLPMTLLGPDVIELELIGARFEGTFTSTGFTGKLGGVIPEAVIASDLVPALAAAFQAQVALDCPGATPPSCECEPASQGETYLNTFDADASCVITTAELLENPLIQGFLAPDVTYEGVDGISIGVRLTGVTATFTLP